MRPLAVGDRVIVIGDGVNSLGVVRSAIVPQWVPDLPGVDMAQARRTLEARRVESIAVILLGEGAELRGYLTALLIDGAWCDTARRPLTVTIVDAHYVAGSAS